MKKKGLPVKISCLAFILFSLGMFRDYSAKAELVDGIAAVVNEDIITYTDLRSFVGQDEENLHKTYHPNDPALIEKIREVRKDGLNQLIERRLIIQQFNSRGIAIPDHYIEADIQSTIDEQYGRDRGSFIKTLEALGLNLETYKERVRDRIVVRSMQQHEINNEIIVSPYKIEKYYKEHADEFKEGEKAKLRMLYLKKSESPQETEGIRSQAQEILIRLTTGADFASLATIYSEGSEKNQGGEFGFVDRQTLREELRDVAFALNAGQISKVIETKDGFYILKIEEKKPAKVTTLEEARDIIERILLQEEREALQKRWIESLKRKAYIRMY